MSEFYSEAGFWFRHKSVAELYASRAHALRARDAAWWAAIARAQERERASADRAEEEKKMCVPVPAAVPAVLAVCEVCRRAPAVFGRPASRCEACDRERRRYFRSRR